MIWSGLVTTIVVLLLIALWFWLNWRVGPAPTRELFAGDRFRVGQAEVYRRGPATPRHAVVGVHGFCESPAYFTSYYDDPELELILVASGDYHPALEAAGDGAAPWSRTPAASTGTIAYDAEVLIQSLENLVTAPRVRVHGHSRGGAVVIEAARLRPDLFAGVEIVLEAPVLPQAKQPRELPRIVFLMLPLLLPLWRSQPINARNERLWGQLSDERKRALIEALPFNPRRAVTMRTNLLDIAEWVEQRGVADLRHLPEAVVLVPENDRILDPGTMRRSAEQGGLLVKEVSASSHFVTFDAPDTVPSLGGAHWSWGEREGHG